jgi:ribosomal protein S18 acetylase RimI-like enzyme
MSHLSHNETFYPSAHSMCLNLSTLLAQYFSANTKDLETEGEDSWGQITWLAADPRQRKRGYGKAALAKALQAIQVQAESATFGLFANFLKDADEPYTAVDYYEKLRMRVLIRSDFTPVRAG